MFKYAGVKMGYCPTCGGGNIELVKQTDDGNQKYFETEEYVCLDCDAEWEWELRLSILKEGHND